MSYTREEIISALTTIKETCAEYERPLLFPNCEKCELFDEQRQICAIMVCRPSGWELKEAEPNWRAFR